jgi:hypothetical protein
MNRLNSILLAAVLFCGCAHLEKTQPAENHPITPEKLAIRNNAASLLYDLQGNEKNVGKILIIKHASQELGQLIKAISEVAAADEKQMEQLATNDPSLDLHAVALPPGEKAARNAVARTKEHELLFTSGQKFEFNLLLTQTEALSYGWHLAQVAAQNSTSPAEVQAFKSMSETMENLYNQVIASLQQNK